MQGQISDNMTLNFLYVLKMQLYTIIDITNYITINVTSTLCQR